MSCEHWSERTYRKHWGRSQIEKIDSWIHRDGDFTKSPGGFRYQLEYHCEVHYLLKQGRRATWAYDGGTPEEPPEVCVQFVELQDVTIYAPPSYQAGVGLDHVRDENWPSFKRECERWLKEKIVASGDFEAAVLDGKLDR